ncbi:Maf family protein [Propylenella binzhouense]|uniref:Nucleoside triphosphate pyrophosphatase n=1 Tax=Propylenella binzhouense TaxID=2555902 RepID=A0A964T218_9HYPH|nr:Maf family protein [Propylenella binzhouense]MYZ46824.1 septum formation inhibitor Maf [Propylenella binzhouense]
MIPILASSSATRAKLLANAGILFDVRPAGIDERAAERPLRDAGAPPEDLAMALALAKAQMVSERFPGDLVIGADQTLDLEGELLTKPEDMDAARRQLLRLAGRTHRLHAAVACARNGEIVWSHSETAILTMRNFGPAFVGRYLAAVGRPALESVGAYQIEGMGIQLFSRIEGDFFAILGLPLLPLLDFLRSEGLLDS